MKIDFDKINFQGLDEKNKTINLFRVHHFPFYVAQSLQAHIQIIEKEDGYGSEAKIINKYSKKGAVSSGIIFETPEEAMNDVLKLVIDEIIEDPEIR